MTHQEFVDAINQTGEDAARFRWLTANPVKGIDTLCDALDAGDSNADFIANSRAAIDALRRASAETGYTEPKGAAA